jgi:asparagine synthase (glutamine-hydrolyzing)
MCGIAGIIYKDVARQVDARQVERMLGAIPHRGPDGNGVRAEGHVGIGMARLAIIDARPHTMPYPNRDESKLIAYNGEVYNHAEIETALPPADFRLQGSDAETVLRGWQAKGQSILGELNGMYAFALWDRAADTVWLVRDKAGEKPLYWYEDDRCVVFASEIKSILKVVDVEPLPEPVSYRAFEFACGRETLFKNIQAVEPGSMLVIQRGQPRYVDYWKAWDHPVDVPDDEDKIVAQLSELLEDSILMRTRNSCHDIGCLVSGGVDSSLVASIVKPDFIYTGTYDISDDFNELHYAQMVADHIKKPLVIVRPTKEDYLAYRDTILYHLDMPATWTSFNMFMVLKRAAQDVRVILSGEGADELFGGYHRYHLLNHDQKIRELEALEKYDYLINKYYGPPENRYVRLINRCENEFDGEVLKYLAETCRYYFGKSNGIIHGMGITDFYTTMQVLLTMADRMSMAFSIENRSPLLDHRLIQYAYSMPDKYKIKDGTTKYIFKKVAAKFIPEAVANRADKRGFVAPVNIWFGWGKSGKYSRDEYRASVYDAWHSIFFGDRGEAAREAGVTASRLARAEA